MTEMAWSRESPRTVGEALETAKKLLSASSLLVSRGWVDPEAERIVEYILTRARGTAVKRADLYADLKARFPEGWGERLIVTAMARAEGKPLQYLLGVQRFLDHEYEVGPGVLVPRPETEVLAEQCAQWIEQQFGKDQELIGLEVGAGSGAISLELLSRFPRLRMIATEVAPLATAFAHRNADRILGGDDRKRFDLRVPSGPSDVLGAFAEFSAPGAVRADFLISNPPYLSEADVLAGAVDIDVLKYEPQEALFPPAGPNFVVDPYFFYRAIAAGARGLLSPSGRVFVEIAHQRAREVRAVFEEQGYSVHVIQDLAGQDRALEAGF